MKTLKSDVVAKHHGSSSIYPTYNLNSKMMNFMAILPIARDNNPPENLINCIDVQVTSLQMDF